MSEYPKIPRRPEGCRLTPLRRVRCEKGHWGNGKSFNIEIWQFLCACGNEIERDRRWVEQGKIKSCGCLRKEKWAANTRAMNQKHILEKFEREIDKAQCKTPEEAAKRPKANMLTGIFPIKRIKRSIKGRIVLNFSNLDNEDYGDAYFP